jgi:predicted DNA-binding helix-hairpin-helix protein
MNIVEKIATLGESGRWDLCSGPSQVMRNAVGDIVSVSAGCSSMRLFKTLMSNHCSMDCKYCQNSTQVHKPVVSYAPVELARVFMHFYVNNMADGLFLSSAVCGDADLTSGKMLEGVRLLREKCRFKGYIHFKILPGTSGELVKQAAQYADRLSVNIEAPNKSRLSELSSVKDFNSDLLKRQAWIKTLSPKAGQTTQMVVGAGGETDLEVLSMTDWQYKEMQVERVYYSGFAPIKGTPLENKDKTPKEREHRLYCVDFMLRNYGIPLSEFKDVMIGGNLPKGDPKVFLATRYFDRPVDVNEAGYSELVRIPGIGPKTAGSILAMQECNMKITRRKELKSLGVALKRAEPFMKINGRRQSRIIDYGTRKATEQLR